MRPEPTRNAELVAALSKALAPAWPQAQVRVLDNTDSTNTQLLQMAHGNSANGLRPQLLLARSQTAGRGRLGRTWHSQPGDTLTLSMACLLKPADWSGLSLALGLAVADALHPDIRLKWPNDLWLGQGDQGRKLGGMLIETAATADPTHHPANHPETTIARWCVLGVGINIAMPSAADLRTPPACLRELLPQLDVDACAVQVAPALAQALLRFEHQGFAPLQARFGERDALAGCAVKLSDGCVGAAHGVGASGAMLVHTADGVRTVSSDEVSLVR